jgi:gluconolactonase
MTVTRFVRFAATAALLFSSVSVMTAQQTKPAGAVGFEALDPSFWKLIDHGAHLDVMGKDFGFTEGPVWDAAGFLYVSDEEKNFIYKLFPDGRREEVIALGDPDGNTYDRQWRLIDCASVLRAIIRIAPDGKSYETLADRYEGKRLNSPNDVVGGPDGALYFTDPTLDLVKGETQEVPFQGVYRVDGSGKVTLLTKELDQPNGIAFSPDGHYLYVDDSSKKNIRRYRFHPDGTVSDGMIFGDETVEGSKAVPDGMKLDTKGNLYVTGPGGIWVWSPAGKHIGTILVPEQPANLTWGGPDSSTLYITATTSVYVLKTKAKGHLSYPSKAVHP